MQCQYTVTVESELAKLTVMADAVRLDMSATAAVLLSLNVHTGVYPRVDDQFTAADVTDDPVVIEPRASVEPDVMEEQPVPQVGVPALPVRNCAHTPCI